MRKAMLLICAIILFIPLNPKAEANQMGREEVFSLLKDAFEAQVSLSDHLRSKEEIDEILSPYFTKNYSDLFLKANVVQENGKYVTYGSDFAQYYIPYYQFSNETKVVIEKKRIYVFEYFPENTEGPVGYKSHYEGLLVEKTDGAWKVSRYLYDGIPESVIKKSGVAGKHGVKSDLKESAGQVAAEKVEAASIQLELGINPIGKLIQYGALIGSSKQEELASLFETDGEELAMDY